MAESRQRLKKLTEALQDRGLDALLVTAEKNRQYLSGVDGWAGLLLVTRQEGIALTDFRFLEELTAQADHLAVQDGGRDASAVLADILAKKAIRRLAVERDAVTYGQYLSLQDKLRGVELVPLARLVEGLRLQKDPEEIMFLERAVELADAAWEHLRPQIRHGVRELELAAELEYFLRRQGSDRSFDTIVASGPRAAIPHGLAGERVIQPGELVVVDFGAVYQGYHSDLTRTVVAGEPTPEQVAAFANVREAQRRAIAGIKPGMTGHEADALARSYLEEVGMGAQFGHSLGHGVGLAVHELPQMGATYQERLEPGMVVTVEPGIYRPGWGGIRIEDIVVLVEGGCRVLSQASRDW